MSSATQGTLTLGGSGWSITGDVAAKKLHGTHAGSVVDLKILTRSSLKGTIDGQPLELTRAILRRISSAEMAQSDPGPGGSMKAVMDATPDYKAAVGDSSTFWYAFGPVLYRGRLDGSARVLGIASDPGPSECLRFARRPFRGSSLRSTWELSMTTRGVVSTGWRFLLTVATLVMATGVFGDRPSAQQQSAETAMGENFDVRNDTTSAGNNDLARNAAPVSLNSALSGAREAGVARLRADPDGIEFENSPLTGSPDSTLLAVVNSTNVVLVLNASTLATVATISVPSYYGYDVVVTRNQSLAFASRNDGIWVVDLTLSPPALATGLNPIPTPAGMPFVEDLSLTRDGRFLMAGDGSVGSPIAVIDTATRGVVGTTSVLADHNSVEVCDNGSVLVTSLADNVVKRLTIGATGAITDTGQTLSLGSSADPNNTACGPGGRVGVVVNHNTRELRSFIVNGMTPVSSQVLPGLVPGSSVAISRDGTRVLVLASGNPETLIAYPFDATTAVIGAQLWSTVTYPNTGFYYGVDQIAVDPIGSTIFVTSTDGQVVRAVNANTGAIFGNAAANAPTGIAVPQGATIVNGDYDGDDKDDISVYRPSTGFWFILKSSTNFTNYSVYQWSVSTDIPLR
jgi:hypothetical protein